jgi:ATP-dependent Clp protease adaptor protein ClpS
MTRTPIAQQEEPRTDRPSAPGGPGGQAVAEPTPRPAPPAVDRLPPFRVILHNDDVNDTVHVVESIVELTPHDRTRAIEVMLRAHQRGRALLLVTHRERAELYMEQFRSRRLIVTIERAG